VARKRSPGLVDGRFGITPHYFASAALLKQNVAAEVESHRKAKPTGENNSPASRQRWFIMTGMSAHPNAVQMLLSGFTDY
jgi:hypothetical protein